MPVEPYRFEKPTDPRPVGTPRFPDEEDAPIDPVTLEVLWNRLLSVANEQQAALMRTAFSTVVRESQDLACGVFDTRGQMMAQSITGTPGHINPLATGVLVVCLGRATRLAEYVQRMAKTYEATFFLGARSDSDDADGAITPISVERPPTTDEVHAALASFVGAIDRQAVLNEIICADAEEVGVFREQIGCDRRRRHLDHHANGHGRDADAAGAEGLGGAHDGGTRLAKFIDT